MYVNRKPFISMFVCFATAAGPAKAAEARPIAALVDDRASIVAMPVAQGLPQPDNGAATSGRRFGTGRLRALSPKWRPKWGSWIYL